MDASIAHDHVAGRDDGDAGAADSDEALFAGVRGHAEAMIAWAGSAEALALDNGQLESRAMRDGLEFMRLMMDEVDVHPFDGGTRLRLVKHLQ